MSSDPVALLDDGEGSVPGLLEKVLRAGEGRTLRRLQGLVRQVNALEDDFTPLSDAELAEETDRFRARLKDGETLDDLLAEAFAVVREGARRVLGQRPYDVQLMGGAALHQGNIAEMKTGEGKTLTGVFAGYLNALPGKGAHVITVNDFLASYQSDLMGRVYRHLGLTSGCVLDGMAPAERRSQYAADITYGTNTQFGFDYLRDNMAWNAGDLVQRGHHFCIVDEVDSILIDEARTPLIISGPAQGDASKWYAEFARIVKRLQREVDYEVDEKKRTVGILEPGIEKVEDQLGIENLYDSVNTPYVGYINNAVKAKELFRRDKDYVVTDGEVLIVDEHTGRILAGRRYNEGMHQAIEAKERVTVKAENQTLATITLQNYFRLYDKLSGMTGTATTEAAEFHQIYTLGVVPIPTNKAVARADQPDLVYKTEVAKFDAVVEDIVERHAHGQPVLVGTTSVAKSEYLSAQLAKKGITHEVLNAKQHAREAAIIAMAGRAGAVTVATNMAGRGTDIMLGGNAEFLAVADLSERGLDPAEDADAYDAAWPEALQRAKDSVAADSAKVSELGGLYVLGTERHESRRIDNQLRGRSGRQGDPGESRFYLSMADDLMRLFNSGMAESLLTRAGIPDDVPLESKLVSRAIQSAQSQVEARNFEIRKNVLKYDDVLNRQREVIYEQRRRVLEGADLHENIGRFVTDVITGYVTAATAEGFAEDWDLDTLWTALRTLYPVSLTVADIEEEAGARSAVTQQMLLEELLSDAEQQFLAREAALGPQALRELERRVVLSVLDRKWREHLYEMDYLQEGISLRAMAQKDPLVEYQREGYQLFLAMLEGIKEESVGYVFNLDVQVPEEPVRDDAAAVAGEQAPAIVAPGLEGGGAPQQLQYSAPSADGDVEVTGATGQAVQGGSRRDRRAAKKKG